MKNKKGFTLVELIAVIAILITILLVAIPTISSTLNNSNSENLKKKKGLILSAMEIYLTDNKSLYSSFVKGDCYVPSSVLENTDYINSEALHDDDNNYINIFVFYKDNSFIYEDSTKGLPQCQAAQSNNNFIWNDDNESQVEYISSQGGTETGKIYINNVGTSDVKLYQEISSYFIDKYGNTITSDYNINNVTLQIKTNNEVIKSITGSEFYPKYEQSLISDNIISSQNSKARATGTVEIDFNKTDNSTLYEYIFNFPKNNTNECVYIKLDLTMSAIQADAPSLSNFSNSNNTISQLMNNNPAKFVYFSELNKLQTIFFVIPPINGSNSCQYKNS